MSTPFALALSLLLALQQPAAPAHRPNPNGLPELNRVRYAVLGPAYSCRSKEAFARGYEETALFLSEYSRAQNSPDLLFNGACGGENYFDAALAGDDMAVIADLGPGVPLTTLDQPRAFNYKQVASAEHESRFTATARIEKGHTYVVLLSKDDVRGLFAFTVTRFEPDARVELSYIVLNYSIQQRVEAAK
jgi:hypothetical protein